MDLTPSFATWMHVTFLHMWMLHARMRRLPVDISKQIQNELKNHFFYVAEERMKALHKLTSSDLRTKYLRDFFEQWQGAVFSYDEGLIRGDAILATALWTSIFKSDDRSPVENVTTVVEYARSTLQYLDGLSDADFLNIKKFPHAKAAPSIESATPVLEKVAVDT